MGGGWAEPIERVCDEMDVSGECVGGAILLMTFQKAGEGEGRNL